MWYWLDDISSILSITFLAVWAKNCCGPIKRNNILRNYHFEQINQHREKHISTCLSALEWIWSGPIPLVASIGSNALLASWTLHYWAFNTIFRSKDIRAKGLNKLHCFGGSNVWRSFKSPRETNPLCRCFFRQARAKKLLRRLFSRTCNLVFR